MYIFIYTCAQGVRVHVRVFVCFVCVSVVALLTVDLTGKKDRMSDFSCLTFFVVADFVLLPGRSHASN